MMWPPEVSESFGKDFYDINREGNYENRFLPHGEEEMICSANLDQFFNQFVTGACVDFNLNHSIGVTVLIFNVLKFK